MIRLKDTRYTSTAAFLGSAIRVAEYYGFAPLEDIPKASQDTRRTLSNVNEIDIPFARRDEKILLSAARKCLSCMRPAHNVLLAWRIVGNNAGIPGVSFELHVIGASSTIAEALLIVVAHAIAEEAGVPERVLSINNIGSAESSGRYIRDVGLYLRKHIESISPTLRPRAAEDPLGTLVQLIERGHPAVPRAPAAMEYLSEDERSKFWELLEYLEVYGLPYELNPQILGSRECWAHSLFEILISDPETGARMSLAFGGRYDALASRIAKKPTTAATISIACEVRGGSKPKRENWGAPSIYFAQLGDEARRRSLSVLEMLRRSGIPVHQGLWFPRIGEQMAAASELGVPYVLIMGHKEAMENTVMVREVATNSQDDVPLPELTNYLKRRRVVSSPQLSVAR
jgi:histidyl-tRNA synthetase